MQVNWIRPQALHKSIRLLSFQIEITIWLPRQKIASSLVYETQYYIWLLHDRLSGRATSRFQTIDMPFSYWQWVDVAWFLIRYALFVTGFRLFRALLFVFVYHCWVRLSKNDRAIKTKHMIYHNKRDSHTKKHNFLFIVQFMWIVYFLFMFIALCFIFMLVVELFCKKMEQRILYFQQINSMLSHLWLSTWYHQVFRVFIWISSTQFLHIYFSMTSSFYSFVS